jgi:hypothetical protein
MSSPPFSNKTWHTTELWLLGRLLQFGENDLRIKALKYAEKKWWMRMI